LGPLSRNQRLSVRAEAEPHARDLLAWLTAMPTGRLEIWAKRQPLLRDVIEVIRLGSFHLDDIAIHPLLGESEILDMNEKVGVENAVAFFLVRRGADKMVLARRSTTARACPR
jgi:hypothetical protein